MFFGDVFFYVCMYMSVYVLQEEGRRRTDSLEHLRCCDAEEGRTLAMPKEKSLPAFPFVGGVSAPVDADAWG